MINWNLDDLYQGFDQNYEKDLETLQKHINDYKKLIFERDQKSFIEVVEQHIKLSEKIVPLVRSLFGFASLTGATDVNNSNAMIYQSKIQKILNSMTAESVLFTRYLVNMDLEQMAKESQLVKKHLTILVDQQKSAKYLLTEKEEILYDKLSEVASRGWSTLQTLATANLSVKFKGKEITFSDARNLAYDYDKDVRKKAYLAELEAYQKVDDFVALALSNIKREVQMMIELRGYSSALEKTLIQSKMDKATLDAMIEAMKEFRPYFQNYLKAKAKYLGHKGSLPFYDLFAPVGKLEKTYTYEEACQLIIEAFGSYSPKLADFAKRAFENNWIDVYPKKGKRGGAFCSNMPQLRQSRILTNFTGSLSDVLTLAHELGHGYHGDIISDNSPLHWSYPMPLAETASIFCETIVNNHLLAQFTDPQEKLSVLENSLQGDTQVIVDILSRFFFESKVFDKASGPIDKHQMNKMMSEAQVEAYGDGLDPKHLHPYMWLVKGHYYSAGLNFYNFPYAFGLLFGKGLYAKYLSNKEAFVKNYDTLLALTTKEHAEEVARSMKIDITKKEFWLESLNLVKKDIDEVIELFKTTNQE